jgi:hypothetical protein
MVAAKKPAAGKAAAKKPAAPKPGAKKPGAKDPVVKEPVTKASLPAKPAAGKPAPHGGSPQRAHPPGNKTATHPERSVMPTLLFYQKPVVLNRETHRNLKLRATPSFAYAAGTNSVPLTGNEFAVAARQFPILFVPDANRQPTPIALLGLRRDENLFVEPDGRWSGCNVPAFVRRYPYLLAEKGAPDDFAVCID